MRLAFSIVLLFALYTHAECLYYQGGCRADWMQNLLEEIKNRPLSQLKLPGSHDSGAYQLNLTATTPMEVTTALDWFTRQALTNSVIFQLLQKLSLAQPLNIMGQLEQGIRTFDFRILYNSNLREFFLAHSFATDSLDTVLRHIRSFLSRHSGELLVIEVQIDSEHVLQTTPYAELAVDQVRAVLGDYLIPMTTNGTLNNAMTLKNLVESNQRVLLTFTDWSKSNYTDVWPHGVTVDYWPNGQDVGQSMDRIQTYLSNSEVQQSSFLKGVFFTVTPSQDSIVASIIGEPFRCATPLSLFSWAALINPVALNFLRSNQNPGLNIVYADAPTDDYISTVIGSN